MPKCLDTLGDKKDSRQVFRHRMARRNGNHVPQNIGGLHAPGGGNLLDCPPRLLREIGKPHFALLFFAFAFLAFAASLTVSRTIS